MRMRSAWVGGLAGALGLLAVAWMAAPSARAQDEIPEDPGEFACEAYEILINCGVAFCDGGDCEGEPLVGEGCEPDAKDCSKLCKNASKLCGKAAKDALKAVQSAAKGTLKEFKILCSTADDAQGCKRAVKDAGKGLKEALKAEGQALKDACKASSLDDECVAACEAGDECECANGTLTCPPPV